MQETQELVIENYHKKSEKIEDSFLVSLLLILSPLMIDLASLKPLTRQSVAAEIAIWTGVNAATLKEVNEEHIDKVKSLVDGIFGKPVVTQAQVEKYSNADDQLVNSILDEIKTKYQELAVIQKNYAMNPEVMQDYINDITRAIENKVKLFSTMSTISTTRSMMFEAAIAEGYTEYQWHTQRDDRVRPTHAYMDTKWVNFDKPPKETGYYHVAQDWNCRCFADKFR